MYGIIVSGRYDAISIVIINEIIYLVVVNFIRSYLPN